MCGIVGYVGGDGHCADRVVDGLSQLTHRGPDDRGHWQSGNPGAESPTTTLGATRLAIQDLGRAGHQPMSRADRFAIVFNGEVYNHQHLRTTLENRGVTFRSTCDTEVFLAAWAEWGESALEHIDGMYAAAIHDKQTRTISLIRDRFGIKPLYYAACDAGTCFASEIPVILTFPGVPRRGNPERIRSFLADRTSDHGADTMMTDVFQVPPGCVVVVDERTARPGPAQTYWSLPAEREGDDLTLEEATQTYRRLFTDAVHRHLTGDVPVACALSGGMDSSSIVAQVRAGVGASEDVHTFTYVADHPDIDESAAAQLVSTHFHCIPHPFRATPDQLVEDFDDVVTRQFEPFGDPVIYAQYRLFAEARRAGFPVLLTGEGADEVLGGYDRMAPPYLSSLVRGGRLWSAATLARNAPRVGHRASQLIRRGIRDLVAPGMRRPGPTWLDETWFTHRGVSGGRKLPARDLKDVLRHFISQATLPALLRFQDRNAMASSVENRVPFLDRALVEFALSLPDRFLFGADGTRKRILRSSMTGMVPELIRQDFRKRGFSAPAPDWLAALEPWVRPRLAKTRDLSFVHTDDLDHQWQAVLHGRNWGAAREMWRALIMTDWLSRWGIALD